MLAPGEWVFALALGGGLVAVVATVAGLVLTLDRVPGLRPQDGPQPQGAHSRSAGALMIAGGGGIALLGVVSWSGLVMIAPTGIGIALLGASGFARTERAARRIDLVGTALVIASALFFSWRLHRA